MKFKQLEWIEDGMGDFSADGFFGTFCVEKIDGWWEGFLSDSNDYDGFEPADFPTVEQAKAYCQSLFEKQAAGAIQFIDWEGKKSPQEVADFLGKPIAMDLRGGWSWYEHIPTCTGGYWNDFRNGVVFAHHLPDVIEYKGDFLHSLSIPNGWNERV